MKIRKSMSRYDNKSGLRKTTAIWRARRKIASGYQPKRSCESHGSERSKSRPIKEILSSQDENFDIVESSEQNLI